MVLVIYNIIIRMHTIAYIYIFTYVYIHIHTYTYIYMPVHTCRETVSMGLVGTSTIHWLKPPGIPWIFPRGSCPWRVDDDFKVNICEYVSVYVICNM